MEHPIHKPGKTAAYLLIYALLLALLAATVLAASFDLGSFNFLIALTIAIIKAVLVILFFMHLRTSSSRIKVFAGSAFLWLAILLGLTMTDYRGRQLSPEPHVAAVTPQLSK